jgi:hypothetical protein
VNDVPREVTAADIPWAIPPTLHPEDAHPLVLANLSHAELLAIARIALVARQVA